MRHPLGQRHLRPWQPPFGVPVEPQASHARLVGKRAAVVILVQAAVITTVLVKEQVASFEPSPAEEFAPPVAMAPGLVPIPLPPSSPRHEEIAALVAGGRQLMVAGDISNARLLLQQAAEVGNATAALELGATYDPMILCWPDESRYGRHRNGKALVRDGEGPRLDRSRSTA